MPWLLLVGLLVHFGAHVALVVRLALRTRVEGSAALGRAALAFLISPLAPLWGWPLGFRRTTIAWCAGLAVYALGVALA